MIGVNFTVFGKRNPTFSSTGRDRDYVSDFIIESVTSSGNIVLVQYNSDIAIGRSRIEIFDILGRRIAAQALDGIHRGVNQVACTVPQLSAGTYICRISGTNIARSKQFQIIR
jgi:hypothetical protein